MRAVAYVEIAILVRVVLGALALQNSLLSPVIYVHFMRQRYYQSAFTREALAATDGRIAGAVAGPDSGLSFVQLPGTPVISPTWSEDPAGDV